MKQHLILFLSIVLLISFHATAQGFDKLVALDNHSIKVFCSKGHEQRAAAVATKVDNAIAFHGSLLQFRPEVILLVLTEADWGHYTSFPVYGMAHYSDNKTLIVAAEDNDFWRSFLPPLDQLPPALAAQVKQVYKLPDGRLSMQAFFDLLALHELGHAYHLQGGLTIQRKWMGEFFCNVLLHTYIAEKEPDQLPALTLFPQMVINAGAKEYTYTSLKDIEDRYEEIGQQHPKNYGWFQCRWHAAAATVYDSAGVGVCRKLWDALQSQQQVLDDEALLSFFQNNIHPVVAGVMRHWDRDIIWGK